VTRLNIGVISNQIKKNEFAQLYNAQLWWTAARLH